MAAHLSAADTAWLHMERPTNLMVVNSVLLFDQPVDWNRLKQVLRGRLVERYPRFRQRVVESSIPFRGARWEDDPDFALEHHLHHLALPSPGDSPALRELVGDLMTQPLDRNRPLWHVYLVDGFGSGAALICRMHHCIADGIALARVMLTLTDSAPRSGADPDVGAAPLPDVASSSSGFLASTLASIGRVAETAVRQAGEIALYPPHARTLAGALARDGATALRLLLTPADTATALKGDPGISRRVAWSEPMSLSDIKRIGHVNKATVNDVLLAAVSGALRHYLLARGSTVGEIQALIPFNLRPLDEPVPRELGNRFGLVLVPLPVGVSGAYRRLHEVHTRMQDVKQGSDGPVSYGILRLAGLMPDAVESAIIDLFSAKATAVVTNVPGPRSPIYLAGTPVAGVLVWAPTSGHIGSSISIFSYRGEVTVGLMTDAALVPEPSEIVDQLDRELAVLATVGRPEHVAGAEKYVPKSASAPDCSGATGP